MPAIPDSTTAARTILSSLQLSERLKTEMRHSWLSNGRRESVAEHSWQMAFLAILCHPYLEKPVNLEHSLKMILVHDLVEAEAGDIPFFEKSERKVAKRAIELRAMDAIGKILPTTSTHIVRELWEEFEEGATLEAKFARALDNLEVQIQHNFSDISTWEPIEYELVYTKMDRHCRHDSFLLALCELVKSEAETKMRMHGVDVDGLRSRLENGEGVPTADSEGKK